MDITLIIPIILGILAAVAIYHFVQIIGPIIRMVVSILVFLVLFYLLRRFFNIDFSPLIEPIRRYVGIEAINSFIKRIGDLIGYFVSQGVSFFENFFDKMP